MASQPGKKIRNSITKNGFLGFFIVTLLRIKLNWTFLRTDHYRGGFELEMNEWARYLQNYCSLKISRSGRFDRFR